MVENRACQGYGEQQLARRQRSERRINHDFEPLRETDAYRIAGALEIAGSAGFQLNVGDRVSSPTCQMTEKRQDVLESFAQIYGGVAKPRGKSYRWIVAGRGAAKIGEACMDMAPSRREMFEHFSDWLQADTHSQRYAIGAELASSYRSPVAIGEYRKLLANPYFFAGVFDARGTDVQAEKERGNGKVFTEHAINIATTNVQLLAALHEILDGTVQIRGGESSYGKSINLVVSSKSALERIAEARAVYGAIPAAIAA